MRLSDTIESFIKQLLSQDETEVELKRNELAEYFGCAPSQINYVLATRFTPTTGMSLRAGAAEADTSALCGWSSPRGQHLLYLIHERIGETISETEAAHIIGQLAERKLITAQEADIMRAAVSTQAVSVPVPDALKDAVRARTLKSMLIAIARQNRTP